MIRWIRTLAIGILVLAMIGLGVVIGLCLVANGGWITVDVHPWLYWAFGRVDLEVWLPALLAGWLAVAIAGATLLAWSMYYVWRRRQYESLIARLERELATLRNLPFTRPAPLEDLPDEADDEAPAGPSPLGQDDDDGDGDEEGVDAAAARLELEP